MLTGFFVALPILFFLRATSTAIDQPVPKCSLRIEVCVEDWAHLEPPVGTKQSGNKLNLVLLVSDTFCADNLEVYGSQWVDTPALNRFAKEAIVF